MDLTSAPLIASSTTSNDTSAPLAPPLPVPSSHPTAATNMPHTAAPAHVNVSIVSNSDGASHAALTPEQEQERQLKDKYPNPQRPGGSAFIQKILNRGSKKYFDSGDYNMAKSKSKATNLKGSNSLGAPTQTTTTPR